MDVILQKNIFWTVTSRYGSQVLIVLSNLILARYAGSAGFGEYAFISAVVMIGNAFSTFGTDMVLIRRISAEKEYAELGSGLGTQLLISSIFILGVCSLYLAFPIFPSLLIYVFALIPLSFFTVFTIALRGAEEMILFSLLHFSVAIMQLLGILLLIWMHGSIFQLAFILVAIQILSVLFGYILCKSKIDNFHSYLKISWSKIFSLMKSSLQMALIGTCRLIYEKLPLTMSPMFLGISGTGLLSASTRVIDVGKLGYLSALTTVYPQMVRDKTFITNRTGFSLLLFSSTFFSLLLFVLAKPIILVLFGSQFESSIISLRVIAWIFIPYVLVSYYTLAFVAIENEKPVLHSLMASVLVLLILLAVLSPLYGLLGAAISILVAEIFQASLLWLYGRFNAFSKLPK